MSAAGRQNGSGQDRDGLDLAALRVSVRCGRPVPLVRHVVESYQVFAQRRYWYRPIALCGVQVARPDIQDPEGLDDPDEECLGCRDCLRYCPECAREALRWSGEAGTGAELPDSVPAAPGGGSEPAS